MRVNNFCITKPWEIGVLHNYQIKTSFGNTILKAIP